MGLLDMFIAREFLRDGKPRDDDFEKVLLANTLFEEKEGEDRTMEQLLFLDTIGFFDDDEEEKKK